MLAPMAGLSDLPYRELCRSFGADYAVSEMTASRADLRATKKSLTRWVEPNESGLKVVQILGADPQVMAQAALQAQQDGADVVDINMGCPAKKVLSVSCGSALMQSPSLVQQILASCRRAISIPLTLKIRTGWHSEHKNALEIARIAQEEGVDALVIHGRTRADGFTGPVDYDTIAQVKSKLCIPVIANGSIENAQHAKYVLEYTQADGLMIGRGAVGRPWLFDEIKKYLNQNIKALPPNTSIITKTIQRHLDLHLQYYACESIQPVIRKHLSAYLDVLKCSESFRVEVLKLHDPNEIMDKITAYVASTKEV